MRWWCFGALALLTTQPAAATVPDMLCRASGATFIDGKTLVPSRSEWSDVYRFSGGALLISGPNRREYFYGKLVEVEPGRFVVGYLTLQIDAQDERRMLVVHADKNIPMVITFLCGSSSR
jgi:hypothetical protein